MHMERSVNMIKSNIGNNIKRYRVAADLTQIELAEKMGISRPTISSWEVNRTQPAMQDIQQLAEILDCSVHDLLGNYAENMEINEYLSDPDLRRLILFAGGNIPQGARQKMVDAIIFTIQAMNAKEGK